MMIVDQRVKIRFVFFFFFFFLAEVKTQHFANTEIPGCHIVIVIVNTYIITISVLTAS